MSRKLLLPLFLFVAVPTSRTKVSAFNIEDRNPIVKIIEDRQRGSYFGFSVAQHAVKERSRDRSDYWLLVGAPLGKNLQPRTNHSGALFKCPITSKRDDCQQVRTDGKRLDTFDYDDTPQLRVPEVLLPPGPEEIKEDQWLGVTVKSQKAGGKVIVCAHRYIQSNNLNRYHHGMGLCYLLTNELETEKDLQPCRGRPTDKLHQQYGFCQVGTSLAILSDGFALLGSPGPYTWRGTVFANDVERPFMEQDRTVYRGPLNDNPTPIDKYSYLGMSVTGGHFFSKGLLTYASGAPRSNSSGQVYFFNKTKSVEELGILMVITGEQFASSFGYEILATDVDNDGYDELLVGAPFYYAKDAGGAVYIFRDLRSCTSDRCHHSAFLTGKVESRFGFSMTSLGDINRDGFADVAIGAPYESGGGAVYIYLGSKDGLKTEPSQVIRDKRGGVTTMGYSLSGGMDMDQNDYPDLLVGAYDSDMAILYKTRPIIDITIAVWDGELNNLNVTKKGCRLDPGSNKTCFSFTSCVTISKFQGDSALHVVFEVKELTKRIPRVTFTNTNKEYITIERVGKEKCIEKVAYLIDGIGDILTPIKFVANCTLQDDVIDSPILNKTSVKEFQATFQKDCGTDDICKSHLILSVETPLNETGEDGYIFNLGENKELVLDVTVNNTGESAYEAKLFVVHPETLSYVALKLEQNKTSNTICTSYNETMLVTCNLGNPFHQNQHVHLRLRFEIKDTTQQKVNLTVKVNSTSMEMSTLTSRSLEVILQKIGTYLIKGNGRPPNILYAGEVRGQSAMRYLEDIGPRVVHTYDVINQGLWNMRDVDVVIEWPYQVYSSRPEGGKWLLYLEGEPMIDNNNTNYCIVDPPEIVNHLSLNSSGMDEGQYAEPENFTLPGRGRRRRDVEEVVASQTIPDIDGKPRKVVTMSCTQKTALCAQIRCRVPQLSKNSQVKIQIFARVWNSTLIEDYSKVDWVSIKSTGSVIIESDAVTFTNDSIGTAVVETTAYPSVVLADTSLSIWIIIASVLAGLLLLVILIVVLYKFGFFKRRRVQDHTLSGNLKKQGESETLLKEGEGKGAKGAKKTK